MYNTKLKLALVILLSGALSTYGQDSTRIRMSREKFNSGNIGLRYQLAYNGSLQSQFTVSGFVAKRVEVGGTFALNFNRIVSNYQGNIYSNQPSDSGYTYQTTNKSWGYTLGFSPYVIGHFPIKGRFDLYLGAIGMFQISNTCSNSYTFYNLPSTNFESSGNITNNPVEYSVGIGPVIGCQYFFTKRFALGIQAGEWLGHVFVKRNSYYSEYSTFGSPLHSTNSTTPLTFVSDASVGGYAGITLSYYFVAKKKGHRLAG